MACERVGYKPYTWPVLGATGVVSSLKWNYPKDHWTFKTGYFDAKTPLQKTGSFTLPLEGPIADP